MNCYRLRVSAWARAGFLSTFAFMLAANCGHAAELSATEKNIVAAIKARSPAALQLLERSVNINSGTMNPAGVREVGRLFRAEFDALGFQTQWLEMPPAMDRAGQSLTSAMKSVAIWCPIT